MLRTVEDAKLLGYYSAVAPLRLPASKNLGGKTLSRAERVYGWNLQCKTTVGANKGRGQVLNSQMAFVIEVNGYVNKTETKKTLKGTCLILAVTSLQNTQLLSLVETAG